MRPQNQNIKSVIKKYWLIAYNITKPMTLTFTYHLMLKYSNSQTLLF